MCTGNVTAIERFGSIKRSRIVLIDVQIIGDDLELIASHLENVVLINCHSRMAETSRFRPQKVEPLISTRVNDTVKSKSAHSFVPIRDLHARNCACASRRLAVHAGHAIDEATGAVAAPIQLSTTFERAADGSYPHGFIYSRSDNPNRKSLEQAMAALEGGREAAAFGSGLAATAAVFQALRPGDHVLAPIEGYHGAFETTSRSFPAVGIAGRFRRHDELERSRKSGA